MKCTNKVIERRETGIGYIYPPEMVECGTEMEKLSSVWVPGDDYILPHSKNLYQCSDCKTIKVN